MELSSDEDLWMGGDLRQLWHLRGYFNTKSVNVGFFEFNTTTN
jgi:hypothetical protein